MENRAGWISNPAACWAIVERMPQRAIVSSTLRIIVCWGLMAFCWLAMWLAVRGILQSTVLLVGLPVLLIWSCILPRNQRALAWLSWVSILAIILLATWLPVK